MSYLLWLPVLALAILGLRYFKQHQRNGDLGQVSAQWLHEKRRETHQND